MEFEWGRLLDVKSNQSWQRLIWIEAEADCFLINIQNWFRQPEGPDSDLFDHAKHIVISLSHGKDAQDCIGKLIDSVPIPGKVSAKLPIKAILKSLKHRDQIVGLMFTAAAYQNKEALVMWADRDDRPNKLRKLALRWGLIPTEFRGRTLYVRETRVS